VRIKNEEGQMKRGLTVFLTGIFMITGVLVMAPAFAQTPAAIITPPAAGTTGGKMEKGEHRERHPMIHEAITKLRKAKEELEKANKDFGGHRVKAIQAIDIALQELKEALESDKK
jgi:hypothetical protein